MKKIVFVSNETEESKMILKYLSDRYTAERCAADIEELKKHISVSVPDMIVLNMTDANTDYTGIIKTFKESLTVSDILFITTEDTGRDIKRYAEGLKYSRITKPFSEKTLITRISEIFDAQKPKQQEAVKKPYLKKEKGEKLKILLADDSAIVLRSVKLMLQDEYDVVLANSGVMALEKLQKELPDLLLLDYEMPDMCGNEVFEKMLAIEACRNIPVIFLTAVSDKERVFDVLKNKPAGYLLKPITKAQITEAIRNLYAAD